MKKVSATKGALSPMGAAPQAKDLKFKTEWTEVTPSLERLKEIAKRLPKEARAKFMANGRAAIEQDVVVKKSQDLFLALVAEIEPVFKRYGISSRQLVVKFPVTKQMKKVGQKGWLTNTHVEGSDRLEFVGVVAINAANLTSSNGRFF